MCVYICVHIYDSEYVIVWGVYVCVHVCVGMHICECTCPRVCACVYACLCVCERESMLVFGVISSEICLKFNSYIADHHTPPIIDFRMKCKK